jgi:molecular chaperone GrpE
MINEQQLETASEQQQTHLEGADLTSDSTPSATAAETSAPQVGAAATQDSLEPMIAVLTQEIVGLKEQLQQQSEQEDTLKARYVALAAEFDNFRKRTLKEKEELERQIKGKTLSELLPVIDNFERARTQIKPANDGEMAIHKSYQGVYKNLVDSLKRLGVSAMRPEGQPFDPTYHEAMLQEQTDEYPDGTVIEQLVRGYLLGDHVLRHALVKVAAPKESVIPSEDEAQAEGQEETNHSENEDC